MINNSQIKNKRTISLLRNLLGGKNNLWTTIVQSSYQSSILDNTLSKILNNIIEHKLSSAEEISRHIVNLGAKPFIENGKGIPWSTRYVDYNSDPLIFLKNNIVETEMLISNLNNAINYIQKEEIKESLKNIVELEKDHLEDFGTMLRKLENSGSQ